MTFAHLSGWDNHCIGLTQQVTFLTNVPVFQLHMSFSHIAPQIARGAAAIPVAKLAAMNATLMEALF